jgi:hypothetical protein
MDPRNDAIFPRQAPNLLQADSGSGSSTGSGWSCSGSGLGGTGSGSGSGGHGVEPACADVGLVGYKEGLEGVLGYGLWGCGGVSF